jgi:hypothetical protein
MNPRMLEAKLNGFLQQVAEEPASGQHLEPASRSKARGVR